MASYTDLKGLQSDSDLRNKIEVALSIAIQEVLVGDDTSAPYDQTAGMHDKRVRWAHRAKNSLTNEAKIFWPLVLAANESLSVATIQAAADSAFLSNVRELVDEISNGLALDEPTA